MARYRDCQQRWEALTESGSESGQDEAIRVLIGVEN